MNTFLVVLFVLVLLVMTAAYFHRIGYLTGKAEVSHIPRGEPPNLR